MKLTAFSFSLLAVGFLITTPSYHGDLGKTSSTSAALAVLSNCPKSQCLVSSHTFLSSFSVTAVSFSLFFYGQMIALFNHIRQTLFRALRMLEETQMTKVSQLELLISFHRK